MAGGRGGGVGVVGFGGEHGYFNDEGSSSHLLGVKICRLVPLLVLKSKMTTVRIFAVPSRVLSRKNMTKYVSCSLKLVSLRGKNIFEPRPSNKILAPLGCF